VLTVILLVIGGILIVFAGAALLVGLFKAFKAIFERLFISLFKSVWGIIMLVLVFWALYKFFPHAESTSLEKYPRETNWVPHNDN
jgi:uncharacterized BrkB/YihY/UPF0761 family membrane protein